VARSVDLLIRADYRAKPGGDVVMAEHYERALREAGARTSLHPLSRETIRDAAGTVHLFNIDRWIEFGSAVMQIAGGNQHPLVVSPIHHPAQRVEYFENVVRRGPLRAVNRLGRGALGRERIKHVLRARSPRGVWEATVDSRSNRPAIARALQQARLVIVLAEAERREIEATFGISIEHNVRMVRNSVVVDEAVHTGATRDIDVLIVGRIEQRKNQLHLAEALRGTPFRTVFIGGVNARARSYQAAFDRVISDSPNLEYRRPVNQPDLLRLYARAKVFASASYFEVVSLAELEAVGYGCQLVAATSGYMMEYIGDYATFLEPTAATEVWLQAIAAACAAGVNHAGMERVRTRFDTSSSARQLVDAYQTAELLT
jgi:glycosyltransferase involved in cell wall biosynthesis